jgi:putative flippase GtrA
MPRRAPSRSADGSAPSHPPTHERWHRAPDTKGAIFGIDSIGPGVAALVHKLIRYAAVSVVSVTIAQTVLAALVSTRTTGAVTANLIATAVATVPSFELNRRWVWGKRGRRSLGREMLPFALTTACGLALSRLAVAITSRVVDDFPTTSRTISIQLASLAAFGVVWLMQFMLLDRVLFRNREAHLA